jgi:hypothetical protein
MQLEAFAQDIDGEIPLFGLPGSIAEVEMGCGQRPIVLGAVAAEGNGAFSVGYAFWQAIRPVVCRRVGFRAPKQQLRA